MRLGVSPTAASTPKGFSISDLRLYFPELEPWGCMVCLAPSLFLPVYLHVHVGPPSLQAPSLPAVALPTLLHNLLPHWVLQPPPCRESSLPSYASLPLLPFWINESSLTPWLSDFHTVRFSVSSGCSLFLNCCCPSFGCARRHSVSTYASILAGS